LDAGEISARVGRAPHHHLEHFLFVEQVADFEAGHQCGRGPAHVAGFEAIAFGFIEIDFDFQRWHFFWVLHFGINDARDPGENLLHLLGLFADDRQVLAVHAHDQGFAGPRQLLSQLCLQIGQHFGRETWIAGDHFLHRGHGGVIVGLGIDADPELAGIHIFPFVRQDGAPHIGAHVVDARNGPQLAARQRCDPAHGRMRSAGTTLPANHQVVLLETWDQRLLAEEQSRRKAESDDGADSDEGCARCARGPPTQRAVDAAQHPSDGRLTALE